MSELREKIAELCHEQWALWVDKAWGTSARDMRNMIMRTTIPYAELAGQEPFLEWADKVLELVEEDSALKPVVESGTNAQSLGWVSVEESLPKVYELVWAIWDGYYALLNRQMDGTWIGHGTSTSEGVTHWLPLGLPDPPK